MRFVPLRHLQLIKRSPHAVDPGIHQQDVEMLPALGHAHEGSLHFLVVAHIRRDREVPLALAAHRFEHFLEILLRATEQGNASPGAP